MAIIGEDPIKSPGNIELGYPYSGTLSGEEETTQVAASTSLKTTLEGLFANRDGLEKIIMLLNRIVTVTTVTISANSVEKVIEKCEGVDALANSLSGDNLGETVIQSLASDVYKMIGSDYSLSILPTEEQRTSIASLVLSFELHIVYLSKIILDVQNRFMMMIGSAWNVKLLDIYIISIASESFGDIELLEKEDESTTSIATCPNATQTKFHCVHCPERNTDVQLKSESTTHGRANSGDGKVSLCSTGRRICVE